MLSAATFGTSGTFAASLIQAGWSPGAAVRTRIAVSALILTAPALVQLRGRWHLLRRAAPRVAAYGLIAVAGCQLFYFNAVQRIPVGVALLLEYLGTVLVVGWLWLRHGERPRRLTVIGTASAIAGLFLVLGLTGAARIDLAGVMWGLLAAVGLAIYFVLSAAADEPLPPIVMAWGGMCVGAAALGRARRDRRAADDRHGRRRHLPRSPGQLDRAGARAVRAGRGRRLRGRHRRGPPARGQARLVHRHGRGPVRDPVRLAAARPAAVAVAVPGRRVHPGRHRLRPGG